jgi:thiamine-phosphate pyrophosphorylase
MRENLAEQLRLLLVTDDALLEGRDAVDVCAAAVQGGVTMVELRLKHASPADLVTVARRLIAALTVPVLVNDRADVALAAGAAGVHVGPDDLAPRLIRPIAPPGFVIGASVGTVAEVERGLAADYWGVGPLHLTTTKGDAGTALELEGARQILAVAGARPCVAIGGVTPADMLAVEAAGFAGVAVARGILGAEDVAAAARRYFG